jgi:hypothetical protein
MKYLIFSLLLINFLSPCVAQTSDAIKAIDDHLDRVDSIAESKPHLEIGSSYVSLVSFNGRTDFTNFSRIYKSRYLKFVKNS